MVWMGKASRDQAVQAAMVALATEMAVASSFCPHRGAVAKKRGGLPFLLRMGQRGAAEKAWTRGFPPVLRIDRLRSLPPRRDQRWCASYGKPEQIHSFPFCLFLENSTYWSLTTCKCKCVCNLSRSTTLRKFLQIKKQLTKILLI